MYALISGRTNEPRDWAAVKELYAPSARLIPIENGPDGTRIAFDTQTCTRYDFYYFTCEFSVHIVGITGLPGAENWYNASEPAWRPR